MMKRNKLLSMLLALCMVLSLLPAVAAADEEVFYTLDGTSTGGSNGYATESEITQNNITWMVTGNTTMNPWRIGGKSLDGESRPIYSTNPMNETVTKVDVEVGGITLTAVNALTLIVASDDSFETIIDWKEETSIEANSTITFTPSDGKEWTNAYYKFAFSVNAGSSNQFIEFKAAKFYKTASDTPTPTYTVSFDANGGTGTMANVTVYEGSYPLPACGFTAPEGKEFDCWAVDGDENTYAPGDSYTLTADTTFIAQWKDLPVVNYTDMMLKRVPANGDTVVIYYPTASKVMTAESYYYNNKKYELAAADATLTDNVLAVPDEAVRLTVSVADGKYTFATADGKYLEADGTNVQLVSEQGANTLFQLETAAAGTDNYYIKCDSATYNGNAQYIEYYGGYFTVYSLNTSSTPIFTFQFFSEDGEGPTPEQTYTVTLNPGDAEGDPQAIEDVTSPYTLPECMFTAPEGKVFAGWRAENGTVYAAGAEVVLTADANFTATWKELESRTYELVTSANGLVDGGTYLIASELFADERYLMSKQTSNNRAQYKVTGVEGTTLTLDESRIATAAGDALAFEFTLKSQENGWAFYDAVGNGYLYAASSSSNQLKTQATLDANGIFKIAYEGDDGATVPVAQGANTRNCMHYNATSDIFSCYAETSSITGAVYLYKLVEEPAPEPLADGFYLIGRNGWTVDDIDPEDQFKVNPGNSNEYMLETTLAVGNQIKVVRVADGAIAQWYPDPGDNYTVDAAHSGTVAIYFQTTYNSGWSAFGGHIYINAVPSFQGHSLLLSGQIGVYFYMNLNMLTEAEKAASYMTFTISKGTVSEEPVNFSSSKYDEATQLHGFICYINSVQMAETITATFHYGDGEKITETYTVEQYFTTFDKKESSYDEKTQRLVHSIADYGYHMQRFLSKYKGWELGTAYTEMTKHYTDAYTTTAEDVAAYAMVKNFSNTEAENRAIKDIKHSLVLDSETTLCIYVEMASGYEGVPTITIDGEAATVTQASGMYRAEIPGIAAHELSKQYTVTVTVEGETATADVYALSYLYALLTSDTYKDDPVAINAAGAILEYSQAADNYRAKN